MGDGKTERLPTMPGGEGFEAFNQRYRASVVVVSGEASGHAFVLERERLVIGRGPDVDAVLNSSTVSRQHAAVEYADGAFRVVDLGSTNGIVHNGLGTKVADLKNGDRVEMGDQIIQFVVEERESEPEVFELPEAD